MNAIRWTIKNAGREAEAVPTVTVPNPTTHKETMQFWQVLEACAVTFKARA